MPVYITITYGSCSILALISGLMTSDAVCKIKNSIHYHVHVHLYAMKTNFAVTESI